MSELIDCIDGLTAKDIIRSVAKTGNGVPFYINTMGLLQFCATYQTIYDAFTTKPSAAIAAAQNTMVCTLVDNGVWAKLDLFYLFAQTVNSAGEALINWVLPGSFDATAFNAPLFTSLEGFTGDGLSAYIDTGWDPATDAIQASQNDMSFGFYSRTNVGANGAEMAIWQTVGINAYDLINAKNAGGNAAAYVNSTTVSSVANANANGLYIAARLDSTDQDLYRNKVLIRDLSIASTGFPNIDLYILGGNNDGVPSFYKASQLSMAFVGSGFSQTHVDDLTDAVEAYMDSNGKGVIP